MTKVADKLVGSFVVLLGLACFGYLGWEAFRPALAAVSSNPVIAQTPKSYPQQILPADTTTAKTLVTAGANGTIISGITCSNTDTATGYAITLSFVRSSTIYVLATTFVPLSSGNVATISSNVPATNLMLTATLAGLPNDQKTNPILYLLSGDTLTITSGATVNTGKVVSCVAVGADF